MIMSILVLVFSVALFFFYVQAFCERAIKREFSQPYFQDIVNAIQLEFPRLQHDLLSKRALDCAEVRTALKCDYATLSYLLANSDRRRRKLSWQERVVVLYFHFLCFCLPFRYAAKFHQREAVLKLTGVLQYLANLTGEKVSSGYRDFALSGSET